MRYIIHYTAPNERVDTIAHKYYANEYRIQEILDINPHITLKTVLSEGTPVAVPIDETIQQDRGLPIWKM